MRQLKVNTFLTLDGVMQAPGGPEEDTSGGFEHGGWTVTYWDAAGGAVVDDFIKSEPFELLLGRKTYEIFASYWPHATEEQGPAKAFNEATKHVASRTLTSLEWENSRLIEGDVAEPVAALKQQDGPSLHVHGSGNLVQTLLRHGLIDVFSIFTFPVVVGAGKRFFADGTIPGGLELVDHTVSTTGVVIAKYVPAGELVTGSFALDA